MSIAALSFIFIYCRNNSILKYSKKIMYLLHCTAEPLFFIWIIYLAFKLIMVVVVLLINYCKLMIQRGGQINLFSFR